MGVKKFFTKGKFFQGRLQDSRVKREIKSTLQTSVRVIE